MLSRDQLPALLALVVAVILLLLVQECAMVHCPWTIAWLLRHAKCPGLVVSVVVAEVLA